jgi:chromate transporter
MSQRIEAGPLSMTWPEWSTINPAAIALFGLSCLMLLVFHQGLARTLAVCASVGVALGLAGLL